MNPILLIILAAAKIASAAVLPPALPLDLLSNPTISSATSVSILTPSLLEAPNLNLSLQSLDLPDSRFKARISIGGPLLPINSALINILYFMSIVAAQDFMHQIQPRTYSTPNYRDVQITTYAWTEVRFLLWAIYYTASDMVKYVRFNDVMVELIWEDKLVGLVKIAVKRALSLAGEAGNLTMDLGNHLAHTNLTSSGEDTMQPKSVVGNVTDSDLAPLNFSDLNASTTFSLPPSFAVSFVSIAGAGRLNRNEVFLTFYTALLHVAQFSPESQMQPFQSVSPSGNVQLHMQKVGIGCPVSQEGIEPSLFYDDRMIDVSMLTSGVRIQYGWVISALLYVPKYMMEHSDLGYRETSLLVKLRGQPACLGTLVKGLRPDERRSLEGSQVV